MATFAQTLSAGANDAAEKDDGTGFSATATTLEIASNSAASVRGNGGLRFTGVTIPQGATITAATLTVWVDNTKFDSPALDIFAEAADNASDFVTNADVTSRTRGTASVGWVGTDIGTGSKNAPDIAAVIQEVVNRAGWVSGNAFVLLVDGRTTPNGGITIQAVEFTPTPNPASLSVTYTFPQTINATGIASTAAVGTPTVTPGPVTIAATGIASTAALGAPSVTSSNTVSPTGIASTAAVGTPTVTPGPVTINPSGIAPTSAVGSPTVSNGGVIISPAGIAPTAAVGAPSVTPGPRTISPTGIASTAAVGAPTVTPGPRTLAPTGIASTAALGAPTVTSRYTLTPAGIASTAALGTPALVQQLTIAPAGIASTLAFGVPAVTVPANFTIIDGGSVPAHVNDGRGSLTNTVS